MAAPDNNETNKRMKMKIPLLLAAAVLVVGQSSLLGQAQRRAGTQVPSDPAAEQALTQALAGPQGEYAACAEYAAIVEKFGAVQPYAAFLASEQCHIAALKRHFEMRGLAVPEDPYAGKIDAPATLQEAARMAAGFEERNVAMYAQLLQQVKNQADLVRVFTHLQSASQACHLPAFQAAAKKDGQLQPGEFGCGAGCGNGCGQGRGGPPPWAGGAGKGGCGMGSCNGTGAGPCVGGQGNGRGPGRMGAGRGYRGGAGGANAQ